MALMVDHPIIETGGISGANPNTGRDVFSYQGSASNSDLMQLFADARLNSERYNSAEAEKNRKWQEYMSNTAHQREVNDLIAAGLNPILSVTGGNGASTPAGSEAQLADNSASIMSLMGAMMSAGAVVGAAAINANSAMSVARLNNTNSMEKLLSRALVNIANQSKTFKGIFD